MTGDITGDDHLLAHDLAEQAGRRLVELRAHGGDPDVLRKAGDRLSHEFLTRELADRRPGDVVLLKASRGVGLERVIPLLWPSHATSEVHG